jgi:glutamine amidotransferase
LAFVGVVDSNICNLTSVLNAMTALGIEAESTGDPDALGRYSHLILPGVGSFKAGMESLQASGLDEALKVAAKAGSPLLGLCLGMQLLAEVGAEFGPMAGLALLPGSIDLLTPSSPEFHLPHIGWNEVNLVGDSRLFRAMPDPSPSFYFIHSYGFSDPAGAAVSALTDHGGPVVAAVEKDNVFGVQFHPEKSQRCGLALLKNFVTLC